MKRHLGGLSLGQSILRFAALLLAFTIAAAGQAFPVVSGVISASAFGGGSTIAQGTFIEIYGANLSTTTRAWNATDFFQDQAPETLDGVQVSIGGTSAYICYVSPTQINALTWSSQPTGQQPLVVTTGVLPGSPTSGIRMSAPFAVQVNPLNPQLWAPSQFKIGGTQYAGAYFPDGVTLALPTNAVPGALSRPAYPGDTIVFYGIGFGPVVSNWPAGILIEPNNSFNMQLVQAPQFLFGSIQGKVLYAGLVPGLTGLYQFNVTIPAGIAGNAVPVMVSIPGTARGQPELDDFFLAFRPRSPLGRISYTEDSLPKTFVGKNQSSTPGWMTPLLSISTFPTIFSGARFKADQ
jgi:uncharacterized protein (TIGR03437 family)